MKASSLSWWFLLLLGLNVLDVLVTNPAYESNPFTILMWEQLGIFLSAWIKIGQVLFFGVLCVLAKAVAKPGEWPFVRKLLLGMLVVLVAFYLFVVAWNVFLYVTFGLQ
jgi:hypothetical protein